MADWKEAAVLRNLRSPFVQKQLRVMIKEAEKEFNQDDSAMSFLTYGTSPRGDPSPKFGRQKVNSHRSHISTESLDVQQVIDVEKGNQHSQIVAMMIFDKNNTPKKAGSIYSYYKKKYKKSWFFFAFGADMSKSPKESPGVNKSIEVNESFIIKKSAKRKVIKQPGLNSTLECFLKDKFPKSNTTTDCRRNSHRAIMTGENANISSGLTAPPTSTSPQARNNKSKKNHPDLDKNNSKMISLFDPRESVTSTSSMSQLKMGMSLMGVLKSDTASGNSKPKSQLKNIIEGSQSYKSMRRRPKRLDDTQNQDDDDDNDVSSHQLSDRHHRGKHTASESFSISMAVETLDTSFELAVKSTKETYYQPLESPKHKKKVKTTINKPFLGIKSLFK